MAQPLDFNRNTGVRPFAEVDPIIDATTPAQAIGQIGSFLARRMQFTAGVANTQFFPFSAICRMSMTYAGSSDVYQGTGFYISENLILTAGHNLWDRGAKATSVLVEPGRHGSFTFPSFSVQPSDFEVHPNYAASEAVGFDIGVMKVSTPPPNGKYFSLINYSPVAETPVAVCGYGFGPGVADDRPHLDIDRVRRIANGGETFHYNLQTLGGTSGSPAFVDFANNRSGGYDPESMPVMGVHRALENDTLNEGVLLTPDKIDWIMSHATPAMSLALSAGQTGPVARHIGGLPLLAQNRSVIGGLPLQPANKTERSLRPVSRPLARHWIVVDESNGMSVDRRTFGHAAHDLSGKTELSVRVPNMPAGGSVRWHIPDAGDRTKVMFELADGTTAASASGTSVKLCALSGGHAAVDCMVKDASGTTVESNKYLVSAPQFVFVVFDPTMDTYINNLGLAGHTATVHAEIQAMLRHQYRDVNVRFVMPGDTLPAHLGRATDPTFPGGIETDPSVFYLHLIGDEGFIDPERGGGQGYSGRLIGRNHAPGQMPAPMHEHALSRILVHRFGNFFPDMTPIEDALVNGTLSASDVDQAAVLWGRVSGYIAAHELGHFMVGTEFGHDGAGGLMGRGSRDLQRVSGMTSTGSIGPILNDGGRGASTGLSNAMRRTFEGELAIDPPLDAAGRRDRGRVGSFSLSHVAGHGWMNPARSRSMSGETIHLPGATVLEGWQAEAFIVGIETAMRAALASNPGTLMFSPFVSVSAVLDICDQFGVTLGLGLGITGGNGEGRGAGLGLVFAPGRRIGFYGSRADVLGWIASVGISAQLTVVKGGPEAFGGDSVLVGVAVETIGWFDAGTFGAPIGAHLIVSPSGEPIGATFEFGISVGVPVLSLVEAFAQDATTTTTFSANRRASFSLSAEPHGDTRSAIISRAIEMGASPEEAAAFADSLFQ